MKLSWGIVYLLLWLYRCMFSVVAQAVVIQLTSLGDSGRYQAAGITLIGASLPSDLTGMTRVLSTLLTESLGGVFNMLLWGNPYLINIGFQTLAWIGIVALLRALEPRYRIGMLLLVSLPSFSIWSTVAGKEAVVVFALGLVLAHAVRICRDGAALNWWYLAPLALVLIYKNQYAPALLFLFVAIVMLRRVKQKTLVVAVAGLLSLGLLYLYREQIGQLALAVVPHFATYGASTRPVFFVEVSDVMDKAPYGMFIAFFGPTLDEARSGVLHAASFVESSLMVLVLAFYFLRDFLRMPLFMLIVTLFTLFWILFGTYPLGVMNPGSAIRYRTGYELLVFVLMAVVASRDSYLRWQRLPTKPPAQPATVAGAAAPPTRPA